MSLTTTRAPLFDAPPPLQPVPHLQHALGIQMGLEDKVALRPEVGVGAQLHGLPVDESDRLEEGGAGAADPQLLHAADAGALEGRVPFAGPAGVQLGLSDGEAGVHAGIVTLATRRARGARIQALWNEGVSASAIAERVGLSLRQVHRWLNHYFGDAWKVERPSLSPEARGLIVRLLQAEVPVGWIAETVGFSSDTVRDVRDAEGIPPDVDWKATRIEIQHEPRLFALHLEFAPVKLRRS